MVRFHVILMVLWVALSLFPLPVGAPAWGSRPWDEPVLCPKCQSARVVYIVYGEPKLDADLERALASRKVELGGCLVTHTSKRWECRRCGHQWGEVGRAAGGPCDLTVHQTAAASTSSAGC